VSTNPDLNGARLGRDPKQKSRFAYACQVSWNGEHARLLIYKAFSGHFVLGYCKSKMDFNPTTRLPNSLYISTNDPEAKMPPVGGWHPAPPHDRARDDSPDILPPIFLRVCEGDVPEADP